MEFNIGSKMLTLEKFKHPTLGELLILKAKMHPQGGAPFFVEEVNGVITEVGIRLSPDTAITLGHALIFDADEIKESHKKLD